MSSDNEEKFFASLYLIGLLLLPVSVIALPVVVVFHNALAWLGALIFLYWFFMGVVTVIVGMDFLCQMTCRLCFWLLKVTFGERVARWVWDD